MPSLFTAQGPQKSSSLRLTSKKHQRPKGLWKARVTSPPRFPHDTGSEPNSDSDNELDYLDEIEIRSSGSTYKKRRLSSSSSDSGELYYLDYPRCTPPLKLESSWTQRKRIMDSSSLAHKGAETNSKATCDYEDWEDLKDLFSKAVEQYEGEDASDALPLIRGVIHECHRFLLFYQDPSVLFSNPSNIPGHSPQNLTPPDERSHRDWTAGAANTSANPLISKYPNCKCAETPTAFHAIFGTALFLFGNLVAQDPSLVLEGEPDSPLQYFLAALDVFETGENLPTLTSGRSGHLPEDWRMAIVWGRTLVCVADDTIARSRNATDTTTPKPPVGPFFAEEPNWPPQSPFSIIVQRRPPVTHRMSLINSSPNDILKLAMDQFSRGIFHMPHPSHAVAPLGKPPLSGGAPSPLDSFSRAKELFTIASEVLLVAEKLDVPSERKYWASFSNEIFSQMKMEADVEAWRGPINRARGQCCLIVGTAHAEEFEEAIESGNENILRSEDADEAREALTDAISFLEKAKSSAAANDMEQDDDELQHFLEEALLTLANLTLDEKQRELLYSRAQKESGGALDLSDEMDES
ncbi:hypothetical protein BDP27DRAFT_1421923 [Rhodocollybia butyracea]|uniref:Uncharacterized protein n=1 Tax=Rhodocollybia butyracea TaxID=206335 RepID=A0A9P5U6V6_9AGAR|nr:hypothetical protein BDP27DRAFT_1421923 [Rhodocollybia butyracea]